MADYRVNRKTIEGIDSAIKKLNRFKHTLDVVPDQILKEEAPKIQRTAKVRTPKKTGELRKSVRVRVGANQYGKYLTASASALNKRKNFNYAYIQHENEKFSHPRGGKAKYLESAFVEGVDTIIRRLKREVRYDK